MTSDSSTSASKFHRGGLTSLSFVGLLVTQFLGATNDNILRWLVIGIGKDFVGPEQIGNILMAGTACFVLPYLLLAAPAGYLADRYSKRSVIIACKAAEIAIMGLSIGAIWIGQLWLLFVVVALMGAQSALFGPSKLGSIPEMLRVEKISQANGCIGLTTVISTVLGMALGNVLADYTGEKGQERLWLSASLLLGLAVLGWWTSRWIARLPVGNPHRTFPWNAAAQTFRDLATLGSSRPLLRVALGIMFFWSLGAMAQLNIDQFAWEGGATAQTQIVPLLIALVTGVGLGSVLAGVWSGGRVELGILPLGAAGVAAGSLLLFTVEGALVADSAFSVSYAVACGFLFLLGLSAGLFDVPLAAYMQHCSPPESRGVILAASNFLTFSGILVAAGAFAIFRAPLAEGGPLLTAREIFLACGICTIPVFIYIVWLIPQASLRFVVWLASHTVYRVRVYGHNHLPERGGALLVANHVTWLDGALLLMTSSRPIRMIVYADFVQGWWIRGLARLMGAIPIRSTPKALRTALSTARDAIADGELVCIFPEGGLTRSGQLQAFKPGLMEILQLPRASEPTAETDNRKKQRPRRKFLKLSRREPTADEAGEGGPAPEAEAARGAAVPVVPVYLDELWGSIFSCRGGRFIWKWPRHWPYPVSIWFGPPMTEPKDVQVVRQAIQNLGAEAVQHRRTRRLSLPRAMLRMCRKSAFRTKIADSTGAELTGRSLLMRTLILRRMLLRDILETDEKYVGILLPPSTAGVVVNAAVTLAHRVSANLNYTVSSDVLNACIERAGIRHVLTSRKVMEKLDLNINAKVVCLEDVRDKIGSADKWIGGLQAYTCPSFLLERHLGLQRITSQDELTVIFTSGSTGQPKGVVLTQQNVASNVEAIDEVVQLQSRDVVLGILPFFHSFGYTVTLWTVLGLYIKGVYHISPLDARQVGKLCRRYQATILTSAPTFLRSYIKRCPAEDFASLEVVVAGAEKMPVDVADAFEKKFHVRPVEGYGATELSPLVSVNVPASRSLSSQADCKEGTVGRPVPGVSAKVVHPDTFEDLPAGEAGMLLIKGPNVMKGYLGEPDKTAQVKRDGWYITGDMALIEKDGFIQITGRQSRFSKIGGEMVPHERIEESLNTLVAEDDGQMCAAVTAVPDARKGERLVVIHTEISAEPSEVCSRMAEQGLPNLWIPAPDSFHHVDEIPLLPSGKLDLRAIKDIALAEFGGES